MPSRGVIYLAVGNASYQRLARQSIASLRRSGYRGEVAVVVDEDVAFGAGIRTISVPRNARDFASRSLKTTLNRHSPFDESLYLDSDTLILWPIDPIWNALRRAPIAFAIDSHPTVGEAIISAPGERRGTVPEHLATAKVCPRNTPYFNGGVMLWRRSTEADTFFDWWHQEWKRFGGIDQFALVRALTRCGIPVATLPQRYNMPTAGLRDATEAALARAAILHFCPEPQQRRIDDFIRQLQFDVHVLTDRSTTTSFRGDDFS
jgi:hypothetical protein